MCMHCRVDRSELTLVNQSLIQSVRYVAKELLWQLKIAQGVFDAKTNYHKGGHTDPAIFSSFTKNPSLYNKLLMNTTC